MSKLQKFFNFLLLVISANLTLFLISKSSPGCETLSDIMRIYPLWGIFWGIFTSLAIYFNLTYLAKIWRFESNALRILIAVGSFSLIITPLSLGDSIVYTLLHWGGAIFFGVSSISVFLVMLYKRRYINVLIFNSLLIFLTGAVIVNVIAMIAAGKMSAALEVFSLLVCEFSLVLTNFVFKEKIVSKPIEVVGEIETGVFEEEITRSVEK